MANRSFAALLVVALARAASAGTPVDAVMARAQSMMGRGDYRGALALIEPLDRETGLTPLQHARLYHLLGAAHVQIGADRQALADADVAERDARAIQAFDLLARIESIRGTVWLLRGQSAEALRSFRNCADWAVRSKQPPLIAGAYTRIAAAYQDMGDWSRALDAVNRAQEAAPRGDAQTRAQYLTRKGLIEIELHDGAAATASIEEALALARRGNDRRTEAQVLIDLALLHQRVDRDVERAAGYAAQAAALARELRFPNLQIAALNELGSLLRELGRLGEARDRLTEALGVIAAAGERRDEPYVLKNLGQVLVGLGRTGDGERRLREAAAAADRDRLTRVRWIARLELAELHARRDPAAADGEFSQVLGIVEQQQTNVLLEGFRAGALDQTLAERDPYDRYVRFLIDRGDPERAFAIAERQRARAFLDTLSAARDALSAGVPPGFAEAENAILRRISARQGELRTAGDGHRRTSAADEVDADERALTALRLRLAADRPALAQARFPTPWALADVQARLVAPDEVVLAFFLGADRSVAWLVDRGGFAALVLPGRRAIEDRVQAALRALRDPRARDEGAIGALSKSLHLDRLDTVADGTHLLIVPHGILYDVPFEALVGSDNRRLLERFPVSYAPSVSSLAFLRSEPAVRRPATTLLAVGNPQGPSALPHAEEELHAIARLFGSRAQTLQGREATEARVRERAAAGARMLHFATHGVIDELRPERSGLVLTASPPADDGLLQMREIYGLRMEADLVTLSACQTALGRNVTGEGIIGLTRAFFYAGARSVVASLWDVDDVSTSRLMQSFYANLRLQQPIDVALQQAKLSLIRRDEGAAAPFSWASFIAMGRTRASIDLPAPTFAGRLREFPVLAIVGAVAAASVFGGVAVWLWTRTKRREVSEPAVF